MSLDFKFSCVPPGASLDDRSRRVIRGFALQLCVSSFLVLGPCIFGMRPWDGAAQLLALIFSLNGLITFFIAASRLPSTDALHCSMRSCINQHRGACGVVHARRARCLRAAPLRPASQTVAQVSAPVRSPGRPAPRRWRSADLHSPADYCKSVGRFSPLRVAYRVNTPTIGITGHSLPRSRSLAAASGATMTPLPVWQSNALAASRPSALISAGNRL